VGPGAGAGAGDSIFDTLRLYGMRKRPLRACARTFARLLRDSRGNAMIQFALAGPIFLLLAFMILENGILLFTQATLDNATRDAARTILIGQATSGSATVFTNKLCSRVGTIIDCNLIRYHVQSHGTAFSSITAAVTVDASGNMTSTGWDPGGSQDYVLVQVAYKRSYAIPWLANIISGTRSVLLLSTYAFQNEPYNS
jgi:Flp pilus assembly protein TadG